jgi:hypothetical protein
MYRIFLCAAASALFISSQAVAQQNQQVSFKNLAENSKYTQQQNIAVRDVPNHIVRIYELHRTFPNANAPVINGLRIVEEWDTGTGDRVDGNGSDIGYSVFVMENGDKVFARYGGHVQTNSGKSTETLSGTITSGTGKLLGIQGTLRTVVNFDPAAGFNENQVNIEYSIGQ